VYYSLYDRLLSQESLTRAFRKVKANNGKPGVDGQAVEAFAQDLTGEIVMLIRELREKSYRPGRSAHQAVGKAELFIRKYNLRHVVDMDLSRCFDTLNHDLILGGLRDGVKFLGMVIHTGYTRIREKKVCGLREKVRKMTRRNSPVNLEKVIKDLNPVLRGFANYFKAANCGKVFKELAKWIRRRLRAKQLSLWKKSGRLHRRLRQLGYKGEFKHIKMSSLRNSASPLANYALSNDYLRELGLFDLGRVRTAATASSKRG